MRIIHLLSINGLVKKYWTEQELKSNRSLSLDLLGGDYTKLPDLIFDLNISDETFRIALEVEITRKSNDRYLRRRRQCKKASIPSGEHPKMDLWLR
jgi:hypothetical protein